MQIQIKNIGKIKEANVNLDGLSVIAGGNDTGKTTISKVVFSIIKAFQEYDKFSDIFKENIIKDEIEKLYRHTRFIKTIISDKKYETFYINDNEKVIKKLDKYFDEKDFLEKLELNVKENFFIDKIKNIDELQIKKVLKIELYEGIDRIKYEYFRNETKAYLIEKRLNFIFESEFKSNLGCEKKEGKIIISELGKILFDISIKKNKVSKVIIEDDSLQVIDSTFLESPIILNLFNDLSSESINNIQYHYQDLFKKIKNIKVGDKRKNGFWKEIKEVIGGTFELNKKIAGVDLSFNKKGIDKNIKIINTATGIKSFGLLDLLDQADYLNESNLLILDEPEVHLHPEWQVKYAELIIYLIKERNLSVLITSHSPYMIEALSKFSKNYFSDNIKKNASFYLAEEKKGKVEINDKTNDQNYILDKLVEPFEKLVWN